ncbi:MAG TPA: FGGY family carbohydrate kinase, partial [Bryobacteraceae bacterium]|nr:FGGY family carbohydrate kinase [Bryobacteraceae bacterium]
MPYILALDEGTTSARAALYNDRGQRLAMHSEPLACEYPQSGWVQQNAEDIWQRQLAA